MILILNHKANLTYSEIIKYEKKLRKLDVIILPSNCYLPIFKKGKYILGSQDISEFVDKNRTGEINAKQLKELNVKYSLVGHMDRRIHNKESNDTIIEKLKRCYENEIIPLYCIGETTYENYKEELTSQLDVFYNNFSGNKGVLIYEPVKNIGNSNPKLDKVEEIIEYINEYVKNTYEKEPTIIYGGGVRNNNINIIKNISLIKGLILSAKTLKMEDVLEIYEETK